MDYQAFKTEWLNRRVDYTHTGTYTSIDLVLQYVGQEFGLQMEILVSPIAYAEAPSSILLSKGFRASLPVQTGDIVVLQATDARPNGLIGIVDTSVDTSFGLLCQNSQGTATGEDADAISVYSYNQNEVIAVWRFATDTSPAIPEMEPVVEQPYSATVIQPKRFPYQTTEYRLVVEVPGYEHASFAKSGEHEVIKLEPGKYFKTISRNGMDRIYKTDPEKFYWVNPADNVLKKPEVKKSWQNSYISYESPRHYRADKGDVMRTGKGLVMNFKTGETRDINFGATIWISGQLVEGEFLYGVPAVQNEDKSFKIFYGWGVFMSYLSLMQIEYVPDDDKIQDVVEHIPEKQLKAADYVTMFNAKVGKRVSDFIKNI